MCSSTGVTLTSVDETTEPDVTPEVEPLNWSKLDPKLTKGIVDAQTAIATVENDSFNKGQNFAYASSDAVLSAARAATTGAGIALAMVGWPQPRDGVVYAEFVLVHKDGASSPVFGASMPVTKFGDPRTSLAGSITFIRKYVYAGLLNMTWHDPRTDVEADQAKKNGSKPQQSPAQKTQPVDPVAQHREAAVRDARSWAKWLISRGLAASNLFHYATGCDGDMPKPPPTSVIEAISLAGNTMHAHSAGDDQLVATRHMDLVAFMVDHEIVPLWAYGTKSADGDSVDAKWPISR